MIVVEILTDCIRKPVRLACFFGDTLAHMAGVVIRDDDPVGYVPRYFFQIACRKTDVNGVSHAISFHDLANRQPRSIALAEKNVVELVGEGKRCSLCALSIEELLIPLLIDELATHQPAVQPHWND